MSKDPGQQKEMSDNVEAPLSSTLSDEWRNSDSEEPVSTLSLAEEGFADEVEISAATSRADVGDPGAASDDRSSMEAEAPLRFHDYMLRESIPCGQTIEEGPWSAADEQSIEDDGSISEVE